MLFVPLNQQANQIEELPTIIAGLLTAALVWFLRNAGVTWFGDVEAIDSDRSTTHSIALNALELARSADARALAAETHIEKLSDEIMTLRGQLKAVQAALQLAEIESESKDDVIAKLEREIVGLVAASEQKDVMIAKLQDEQIALKQAIQEKNDEIEKLKRGDHLD